MQPVDLEMNSFSEVSRDNIFYLAIPEAWIEKKVTFYWLSVSGPPSSNNMHAPLPLELLDLSYNHLHSLESHAFSHLQKLTTLLITDNGIVDFTQATSKAFAELESLERLDLSRNDLGRIPQHFFSNMR